MKTIYRFLFVSFCFCTSINTLNGQWIQTNVPSGGIVWCFAKNDTNLFAGTHNGGVFLSTNNGTIWSAVNSDMSAGSIYALTVFNNNLFASNSNGGIYRSINNGTSWTLVKEFSLDTAVLSFAFSDTNFYAGTSGGGIFRSNNNGISWNSVNVGLTHPWVSSLTISGKNLFAGTYVPASLRKSSIENSNSGIYRSTNNGDSWTSVSNGLPPNPDISSLIASDSNIFAGVFFYGVYRSTDNGTSWIMATNGIGPLVTDLAIYGKTLFAGTYDGVFVSTDNGTNWTAVNTGLPTNSIVHAIVISGTSLFAGTESIVWRRPLAELTTSAKILSTGSVKNFFLDQNYPNPFNPTTTISFSIPSETFVSLIIFDVLGKIVSTLLFEELAEGKYSKTFTAEDLSSGVYFYRLQTNAYSETKKLTLLK